MKKLLLISLIFLFASTGCEEDIPLPPPPPPPPPILPPVVNKLPVAHAGNDQTITLPISIATLDGTKSYDSSGAQLSFQWMQISGAHSAISFPTSVASAVTFFSDGLYQFELTVSNSFGKSLDTVAVTVNLPVYCNVTRKSLSAGLNYLTSLPAPHDEERRMIAYGNKLYFPVFAHEVMNIYDVSSGNWTSTPIPAGQIEGRSNMAIVAAGNKIFFAGGYHHDAWSGMPSNLVNIYDISTNTWSTSELSAARGFIKAAVAGNKVVFAGGINEEQRMYFKAVDIYDLQTNTWNKTEMKGTPRAIGAAVTAGNKIFFIAGYRGFVPSGPMWDVMGNPTNEIDIYDASSGQWTTTALQITRDNFAAVPNGDKIYVAGGYTGLWPSYMIREVEVIDVHTLAKTNICLSQSNAFNTQSVVSLNHLVAFFVGNHKLDVYNTVTGEWFNADLPASVGSNPQMAVLNGEIYFLDDPHPFTTAKLFKLKL